MGYKSSQIIQISLEENGIGLKRIRIEEEPKIHIQKNEYCPKLSNSCS